MLSLRSGMTESGRERKGSFGNGTGNAGRCVGPGLRPQMTQQRHRPASQAILTTDIQQSSVSTARRPFGSFRRSASPLDSRRCVEKPGQRSRAGRGRAGLGGGGGKAVFELSAVSPESKRSQDSRPCTCVSGALHVKNPKLALASRPTAALVLSDLKRRQRTVRPR
jgi:hypothetical protein